MYIPRSVAVQTAEHFAKLVESVVTRLHRKHDARFKLLDEAFLALEQRAAAAYPTIYKIAISQATGGASPTVSLTNGNLTIVVTGVNFTTDEAEISATLGSQAMSVSAGASATAITLTLASGSLAAVAAAEQHAVLALRVNGVLCPPVQVEFVA
jgi:hypothetical protein